MAGIGVRTEISGSVWKIEVKIGDRVAKEDPLLILESMKMEIPLVAPGDSMKYSCQASAGTKIERKPGFERKNLAFVGRGKPA